MTMMEIIGVAEDAKYADVRAAAPPLYRALSGANRRLAIVGMTIARDRRRLVLGHTAWLVALGVGLGTPAALALARLLSDLL